MIVILQVAEHVPELIIIFEVHHFDPAQVFLLLILLHIHELKVLLKAHKFAFDSIKDLIEEHRCCISLSVHQSGVVLIVAKSVFHNGDSLLELSIKALQIDLLLF